MTDKLKTQKGEALKADFEDCTWTFVMKPEYEVKAGFYAIMQYDVYEDLYSFLAVMAENNVDLPKGVMDKLLEFLDIIDE